LFLKKNLVWCLRPERLLEYLINNQMLDKTNTWEWNILQWTHSCNKIKNFQKATIKEIVLVNYSQFFSLIKHVCVWVLLPFGSTLDFGSWMIRRGERIFYVEISMRQSNLLKYSIRGFSTSSYSWCVYERYKCTNKILIRSYQFFNDHS